MKKRMSIALAACLSAHMLFAMDLMVENAYPNQFSVSWTPVEGAVHYDLYADGQALDRVDGNVTSASIGSNDNPLYSNREYTLIVAARDGDNKDLDAVAVAATTSSWSGSYKWINDTGDDNKGRCKMIHYVLDDKPEGMIIQSELPELGLVQVSPMPVSEKWTDYDDPDAEIYRANAIIFNTTNFKPSKYKVVEIQQDAGGVTDILKTKAMGMSFTTTSHYRLIVTEEGKRAVLFNTKGSGLAATGIFHNPDERWDGAFLVPEE